jgi:hypothetical protein
VISDLALERQRRQVESLRLRAEAEELRARLTAAETARRAAELEAVKLGLRRECDQGCGRPLTKHAQSPTCHACRNADWMRRARVQGAVPIRGAR